jgi:hypothetical protein
VEIAARVQAARIADLDAGRYTLHISPARSAGTLTSRFSALASGSDLDHVYRDAPSVYDGARPVQLWVPPLFIRGQNVGRIPAYLPGLLSLGEHPGSGGEPLGPEDLAVTATLRGLHLVHWETGQVIEPQVFHPLDLEKQLPAAGSLPTCPAPSLRTTSRSTGVPSGSCRTSPPCVTAGRSSARNSGG